MTDSTPEERKAVGIGFVIGIVAVMIPGLYAILTLDSVILAIVFSLIFILFAAVFGFLVSILAYALVQS